jgi:hypothetical protein
MINFIYRLSSDVAGMLVAALICYGLVIHPVLTVLCLIVAVGVDLVASNRRDWQEKKRSQDQQDQRLRKWAREVVAHTTPPPIRFFLPPHD